MTDLNPRIVDYISHHFGEEYLKLFKEFIQINYFPYIRIPKRYTHLKIEEKLKKYHIKLEPVDNVPGAFIVKDGIHNIGKTLEFTVGKYYIQSLSSMIPPIVMNPTKEDVVLDLCASPGSKTSQIADYMGYRGTFYANESNLDRTKSLVHNLDRMGLSNLGVIMQKGQLLSKYFDSKFDKILVDAPCSALGIVQKKGEVGQRWSLSEAERIAEIQFKLLGSAIKMAKVGGEIFYSTCTLTLEENEVMLNRILKNYPVELGDITLPVKSVPGFTSFNGEKLNPSIEKSRRIIPWEITSEGFFIAKLIKTGETEKNAPAVLREERFEIYPYDHHVVKHYLGGIAKHYGVKPEVFENFRFLLKGMDVFIIDSLWEAENLSIFERVGLKLGSIDKRNKPHLHSIAARILDEQITENIIVLEEKDDLKTYFSGGTIKRIFKPYGHVVVKYEEYIIGTALALPEGLKSQFPRSLRTHQVAFKDYDYMDDFN